LILLVPDGQIRIHDPLTPQKRRAWPSRTGELLHVLVKSGAFHPGELKQ